MDLQLKGKVALVTGSTSGIGEQIAKTLAAEGVKVVVHGRGQTEAERVCAEIEAAGGTVVYTLGNLSEDSAVEGIVNDAIKAFGMVDILINNAGAFPVKSWLEGSPQEWVDLYNANVVSVVRLVQALAPKMQQKKWGRIVNVGSFLGSMPQSFIANYATTKSANISQMVSLARELAADGITCNTISPGPIRTPGMEAGAKAMTEAQGQTYSFENFEKYYVQEIKLPVGRIGTVDDIAHAAAFLCSPLAAFITGTNIRVDGGMVPTVN